jgi:hypothetical protein
MQIRGTVLHARKTFVVEHFGSEAWKKVVQTLSDESKEVYEGLIISAGWYPFTVGEDLDKSIVEVLGKGNPKIFEEIGVQSAQDNLSGAHKTFLALGNPHDFMSQSNSIYQFYYDTGRRTYEKNRAHIRSADHIRCRDLFGSRLPYRDWLVQGSLKDVRGKEY